VTTTQQLDGDCGAWLDVASGAMDRDHEFHRGESADWYATPPFWCGSPDLI
jgi:hypothetical protein